jgi:hypothetical protein
MTMAARLLPFVVVALLVVPRSQAQSSQILMPFIPAEGHIAPGESQSWEFMAWDSAVLSFVVKTVSPDFDPVIQIQNSAGTILIANDDYDYPNSHDAVLEAITIPRFDTYTATVSGFGGTGGDYTLTMLPGYAQIASEDSFSGGTVWRRESDLLGLEIADGTLNLSLTGIGETAAAINPDSPELLDFYTQVQVTEITSHNGWTVGLILRQQSDGNHYALEVNYQGFWRLTYRSPDGERTIQDWTPHPAIIPGETAFTLGALVIGSEIEAFYNGQFIGQSLDSTPATAGQVGLTISTAEAIGSDALVKFDNLASTTPLMVNGTMVLPQSLMPGNTTITIQELQRRHLIPAGGELSLVVGESFVQSTRPGVNRSGLGRGRTYQNFAMGAHVSWETFSEGMAGCGIYLRATDDDHYALAYIDQTGGFGLAQRDGDSFLPGIFGELGDGETSSNGTYYLLVIANGDTLYYYIDDQYQGTLTNPAESGEIGNAVVNFEAIDTTCQFSDTWLWDWD